MKPAIEFPSDPGEYAFHRLRGFQMMQAWRREEAKRRAEYTTIPPLAPITIR